MKKRLSAWIILGVITIVAGFSLAVTNEVTKGPIIEQGVLSQTQAKLAVMPGAVDFEEITLEDGQVLFAAKDGDKTLGYVGRTERKGYGGPVEIIAGVREDGTITGINVGGTSFSETPGLGANAKEAKFTNQFEGKKTPVKLGDAQSENGVDAITAATITSSAVIAGVNQIAKQVDQYLHPVSTPEIPAQADGTTYTAAAEGFAGPVAVLVTVKEDGSITALTIGDDRFAETEGFGAAALEPAFAEQFVGKSVPVALSDIDGIAGATYTTEAVINAINKAYEEKNIVSAGPEKPEGATYTASAEGFAGPVAVLVTVKEDGSITALTIGDDQFAETEGFGAAALEPDFAAQFVGRSVPIAVSDIDGIAGATYTTEAVVNAINKAYQEKNIVSAGPEKPESATYTASAEGFAGPVAVEVAFNEDATIQSLKIGDAEFAETEGFGAAALEPDFAAQFVGKKVPVAVADIEAISGATYTTEAVISAINAAYANSQAAEPAADEPAEVETPVPEVTTMEAPENTLTASAEGFAGPVAVTVSFNPDDTIVYLQIGDAEFAETEGFGAAALEPEFAAQFVGKKAPVAVSDIDAISGATYTTEAVVSAINEAYANSQTLKPETVELAVVEPAVVETPIPEVKAMEVPADTITASAEGFAGPVAVTVSFNPDDTIAYLKIGDSEFAETEGFGTAALESEFAAQFVGKKAPVAVSDIDAIAGATYTTEAVVNAINLAYEEKNSASAMPTEPEPITYTASTEGFAGQVAVEVVFNEDNTIQALRIGDEEFAETEGFGAAALEPEFAAQFISKQLPIAMSDIEAITGATYTTEAVVNAINLAYEEKKLASAMPTEPESISYKASAEGFAGPVAVEVTFNEDGIIMTLVIGDDLFAETEGFGAAALEADFAAQFVGKQLPVTISDIEAISGATYTSEAVVKAINEAFASRP